MKKFISFLQDYLIRDVVDTELPPDEVTMPDGGSLCETGPEIIGKVTSLIALRRPVLLTGSRGCGKSYCALRGALLAERSNIIGGNRFLQGNRELPREYLSEDGLVIESGKALTLPALAMTPIGSPPGFSDLYTVPKPLEYVQWLKSKSLDPNHYPWPTMPASLVDPYLDGDGANDPRTRFWSPKDWWVLFLDEVNRFGDGFLDGLLSLAEEGKVVRRGQAFYVPVVLVCTANPPGYDITAKRLSPPLQSRIAAAYRIGQPSLEVLDGIILEDRLRQIRAKNPNVAILTDSIKSSPPANQLQITIPREIRALACAYLLCLWGDPGVVRRPRGKVTKGVHYLLPKTRWDLHELCITSSATPKQRRNLLNALDELGALAEYGPDARAIGDWFALVIQNLITKYGVNYPTEPVPLKSEDLRAECISVLGKKIRENYNEAADPDKDHAKDRLLLEIFDIVFSGPATEEIRKLVYRNKLELLEASTACGNSKQMNAHLAEADPRWRSRFVETALNLLKRAPQLTNSPVQWDEWRKSCSKDNPLPGVMYDGCFRTPQARHWIARSLALTSTDSTLARQIMLLPCLNNKTNLLLFAAAAQGDKAASDQMTSFPSAAAGSALDSQQVDELVTSIQQIYQRSNLPKRQKNPERALALALGFSARLTVGSPDSLDPGVNEISKATHWFLGWFLEETVPGATPERDLVQPFAEARPLKSVLAEALEVAEAVLHVLSRGHSKYLADPERVRLYIHRRADDLKQRLRVEGGTVRSGTLPVSPNNVRAADTILSDQGTVPNIDVVRANERREKLPFNLAGFSNP